MPAILELSGLGERTDKDTATSEVLGVSDRTPVVVRIRMLPDSGPRPSEPPRLECAVNEIGGLPRHLTHRKHAEFESVTGDASGRVFIVCERSSQLLILAPDLTFERAVHLAYGTPHGRRGGLESLLMLRSGHILSAKQRHPVEVVEFGPQGDDPIGLSAATLLPRDESAELSAVDSLVPLWSWRVRDDDFQSINDLALGTDAGLYAVSSKSRCVTRLVLPGSGATRIRVDGEPRILPEYIREDGDARAEGLLFSLELGAFTAIDTHDPGRDNLYWLG